VESLLPLTNSLLSADQLSHTKYIMVKRFSNIVCIPSHSYLPLRYVVWHSMVTAILTNTLGLVHDRRTYIMIKVWLCLSKLKEDRKRRPSNLIWYTGPTWPRKVAMNLPEYPSHSFTDLSNDALATHRPSGEKYTWFTSCNDSNSSQLPSKPLFPPMRMRWFLSIFNISPHIWTIWKWELFAVDIVDKALTHMTS
jgi:hypothetical protein